MNRNATGVNDALNDEEECENHELKSRIPSPRNDRDGLVIIMRR